MTAPSTRSRLLASAEEAFLRQGFAAANLGAIATRAKISKKTIYNMVSSKAELFAEVIRNAIETEDLSRHLNENSECGLEAPLRAFLLAYANLSLSSRGAEADWLVVSEARQFPELADAYFDSVEATATRPLVDWLERQAAVGRIALSSPDRAARMLIAMVISDPLRSLTLGRRKSYEPQELNLIVNEAVTIFLNGTKNQIPAP
jgi:TetR/AcrR family transcriptional regulator, mexJK operon transcriptional repressor